MSQGTSKSKIVGIVAAIAVVAAAGYALVVRNQGPAIAVPASEPTVRLISQGQYVNTISQIFGPDIAVKIRFAPVKRVDGLVAVGASSAVLTGGGLDPLDATSRAVAEQVMDPAHRDLLLGCKPKDVKAADDECARSFFKKVGRLFYRRALTEAELNDVVKIAGGAIGPAGDFYNGVSYALSGMLMSPEFLFIRETAESDPGKSGASRLDAYSKASRLAFVLWNAAPDDELLTAAEKGDIHKASGLQKQVDRMIASPLFKEGVRTFFSDFYVLEAFDTITKDPTIYPAYTLKAGEEAREQILRTVVDHLVNKHGDYRDLYTTRDVQVSSDLGVLYRTPLNVGSQGWIPHQFKQDEPRAGLLTQIGFLSQYAHAGRSSATRRGRAIREVLLCQPVPDPPPNVDFSKFEDPKSNFKTAKERLTAHQADPTCAGCHAVTDPIGLGLENFDGAGQFRKAENGAPIDANGVLDGVAFKDAVGLGQAVRDNPALKTCIVSRLYAYSLGRKVTPEDTPLLEHYQATLDKRGYKFDEIVRLVVTDKSFFTVKPTQMASASAEQR